MFETVKYYFRLYQAFFSTSLTEMMSFRVHYVLSMVVQIVYVATTLASIKIIYQYVDKIGVWNESEFLFFTSFMLTVRLLHDAVMTRNYWEFSEYIVKGTLDFYLLKPAATPFSVFFRFVRPPMFFMVPVTFAAACYFASKLEFTLLQWILIPFLILLSFSLLASLAILISCTMFWAYRGQGVNFFRMQCQELSTWPDFIFSGLVRTFFTFVFPLLLIGSAPNRFLLNEMDGTLLISMVVFLSLVWLAVIAVWRTGIRQYESASS